MPIDDKLPITLHLPLERIHTILGALGTQPYDRVVGLITEIQKQAAHQVKAALEPPAPATPPTAATPALNALPATA